MYELVFTATHPNMAAISVTSNTLEVTIQNNCHTLSPLLQDYPAIKPKLVIPHVTAAEQKFSFLTTDLILEPLCKKVTLDEMLIFKAQRIDIGSSLCMDASSGPLYYNVEFVMPTGPGPYT